MKTFSHGLYYSDIGAAPAIQDVFDAAPLRDCLRPRHPTLPELPPRDTWVNVRELGAKGDGATDDTEVLQKAIATHRAIYLPRATTSSATR